MTTRITTADLELLCWKINKLTGNNTEPYTKDEGGKYHANAGTYTISGAYGGHQLQQMSSGGGARNITSGFVSKRELYNFMSAYLDGIEAGKRH